MTNLIRQTSKKGSYAFTLVELLVVIFILGVLTSLVVSNLQGARQRARDAKKKADLRDLKTALRLYYNDYQVYPSNDSNQQIAGCGADGDQSCPLSSCDADFAAGGTGCETVYLQTLPESNNYTYYRDASNGNKYCLITTLENLSDSDLTNSFNQCAEICQDLTGEALDPTAGSYAVCTQ